MSNLNPLYFEFDLAKVYEIETTSTFNKGKDVNYFQHLKNRLSHYYLKVGIKPFLTPAAVASGTYRQDYYDQFYDMANHKKTENVFPFFCVENNIYNFKTPCIINRKAMKEEDFRWAFAVLLYDYNSKLGYLPQFLNFQLIKNFYGVVSEFNDFLNKGLDKYSLSIGENVCLELSKLRSTLQYLTTSYLQNPQQGYQTNEALIPIPTKLSCNNIPDDFEIIEGRLSKEQILFFFSFLWKEKSVADKPFLPKELVEEIFKYGIAIPPSNDMVIRHKLNVSKRFPLSIIHYAIHKFFLLHAVGKYTKSEVLRFFCHYFEDFAYAIKSPDDYRNFLSNVSGTFPGKKMNFNIENYIPAD